MPAVVVVVVAVNVVDVTVVTVELVVVHSPHVAGHVFAMTVLVPQRCAL